MTQYRWRYGYVPLERSGDDSSSTSGRYERAHRLTDPTRPAYLSSAEQENPAEVVDSDHERQLQHRFGREY